MRSFTISVLIVCGVATTAAIVHLGWTGVLWASIALGTLCAVGGLVWGAVIERSKR